MSLIHHLAIRNIRNIRSIKLDAFAPINILFGANGSGKTAFLEAIHCLSVAKSFRSHKLSPLIRYQAPHCTVHGGVSITASSPIQPIAVHRSRSATDVPIIKIAGQLAHSRAALSNHLPLQIMHGDNCRLLTAPPSARRKILDWGVFHVEPRFHQIWKRTQHCIKQRNSLLRQPNIADDELFVWTEALSQSAEQLDEYRQHYTKQLLPRFQQCLQSLIQLDDLQLMYDRGWDKTKSLLELMQHHLHREKQQGYTFIGPHRADLQYRYQGAPAAESLSRGQQKLVVTALFAAQNQLFADLTQKPCVFLIDDLPAEIDIPHRHTLCHLLETLNTQIFITCVDYRELKDCWSPKTEVKWFHVEQGHIEEVE